MILDIIKQRKSVRKFSDKELSEQKINYILEAGRLSLSGGNEQPWKFGVVKDKSLIKKTAKIAYNQKWIEGAQALIVLCTRIATDREGGRDIQLSRYTEWRTEIETMDKKLYSKLNLEEHQTKIPGTHMVLAATEQGIGSIWISYFKVTELADLLGLPENYLPSEIIAFVYPKKERKRTTKKSLEEVVFFDDDFYNQNN
ncbi:MAG TPA: nitroreductase family protein [Halanaerobiales bacterium]|nr:nitroreductase family protein [Halanaerobiales bacterium]